MTTSGLATPPRAARPRVPRLDSRPPPLPRSPRPRASYERVLGWSVAVSALVHLLLLLLSPLVIRIGVQPGAAAPQAEAADRFGLEMIVAIPSADAPEIPVAERPPPELPQPQLPQPRQPAPTAAGAAPVPSAAPGDQTTRSARDALAPGYRDPRLYVTPRQFPELQKTEHEVYMEHLQARIDAVNDSMSIAANRERRTSDWTVTDASGNKWGLSPGGLHLGGITIPRELLPLPGATGDNASIQAEREQQRQREEIRRQEEERERRETRDERTDATRRTQDERRSTGAGN